MIKHLEFCDNVKDVDLVIARALFYSGESKARDKSIQMLTRIFYDGPLRKPSKRWDKFASLFHEIAIATGPDLHCITEGNFSEETDCKGGSEVLKRFYLGGLLSGKTLAKIALRSLENLENKQKKGRLIKKSDYYIQFLKTYSSATPIMGSKNNYSVGGGYYIVLNRTGCVVDPGHHFLDNFFRANHSIDEVDVIIVTHFHDDHYADLPSLLSLLNKRWRNSKERSENRVKLFCDKITLEKLPLQKNSWVTIGWGSAPGLWYSANSSDLKLLKP